MRYTPEQQEFVLYLAEAYKTQRHDIPIENARAELGMDEKTFDLACEVLASDHLCDLRHKQGHLVLNAEIHSVKAGNEIEARRAAAEADAADRVAGVEARARRHKYLAPLIVAIKAAAPVVGLIGGICGIVALLLRGC